MAIETDEARLLSVREAAVRFGLPISWLYSAAAARRVPHLKVGRYLKFRVSEMDAWLEKQRRTVKS